MSRTRYTLAFDHANMVPAPAGVAAPKVIYESQDGILLCYGITVPGAVADYAQGCIFIHTDGSAGQTLYVNEGDDTTADFNLVGAEDSLGAILLTGTTFKDILLNTSKGMEAAYPIYHSTAGVGPSPSIWNGAPLRKVLADPSKGFYFWDDFQKLSTYAAGALHDGILLTQNTAEGTLANDPAVSGGVLKASAESVDAAKGPTVQFPSLQCEPADGTTIYIEWRVKINKDAARIFMGLADDSDTALVADDSIATNKNLAGFYRDAGTGNTDYSVGVCDATSSEEDDDAAEAVSKTVYNKFGMVITGKGGVAGSLVKFYVNGVLKYTTVDTNDLPLLVMCPAFVFCGDAADQPVASFDWLRVLVYHADGTCRES